MGVEDIIEELEAPPKDGEPPKERKERKRTAPARPDDLDIDSVWR